jgi:hypothetical protein
MAETTKAESHWPYKRWAAIALAVSYLAILGAYIASVALDVSSGNVFLIGFLVLFGGYLLMAMNAVIQARDGGTSACENALALDTLRLTAYASLAFFFVGSYFFRLTPTVHAYDACATAGYVTMFVATLAMQRSAAKTGAPSASGHPNGAPWIDVLLKVGKALLIAYYGISAFQFYRRHANMPYVALPMAAGRAGIATVTGIALVEASSGSSSAAADKKHA